MVADSVLGKERPLGALQVRQPSGDLPRDFEFALGQPGPAVSRRDHPGEAAADTEGAKSLPDAGGVPGRTCPVIQLKRLAELGDAFLLVSAPRPDLARRGDQEGGDRESTRPD